MRYSLSEQEVDSTKFRLKGADNSEVTISKDAISQWIVEGGMEYAESQIWSTLNLALSNNVIEGYAYISFASDGTPIDFYQQTTPEE